MEVRVYTIHDESSLLVFDCERLNLTQEWLVLLDEDDQPVGRVSTKFIVGYHVSND